MNPILSRLAYCGFCVCASLTVAAFALLPVSAATADALSLRGGSYCASGGCHDKRTSCSGSSSCASVQATACFSSANDTNRETCGQDSGLCGGVMCGGQDIACGGR